MCVKCVQGTTDESTEEKYTQLEQEADSKVEDLTGRKINVHKTNQAAKEQAKAKKQYRIQNPCNLWALQAADKSSGQKTWKILKT